MSTIDQTVIEPLDAIVVGAGFAGTYFLDRVRVIY